MTKLKIILFYLFVLCLSYKTWAQQSFYVISGNIAFKSAKPAGNMDITIEVEINNQIRKQIQLDKTLIFKDSVAKKKTDTTVVKLNVIVTEPSGYMCSTCPCEYEGGFQSLYIKKKSDIYSDRLRQAGWFMEKRNYEKAAFTFKAALENQYYENMPQKYELEIGLSRTYLLQKDFAGQALVLSNIISEYNYLNTLGPSKRLNYWQERFYNILNIARFDTLNGIPLCNLTQLVNTDTALSRIWDQYIEDYVDYKKSMNQKIDELVAINPDGTTHDTFSQLNFIIKDIDIPKSFKILKCSF